MSFTVLLAAVAVIGLFALLTRLVEPR